jgi:microcystin-dependent protein
VPLIVDSVPAGFLELDGTVKNIATYPALAAVYGTKYGGDGTTTFGLPDLRGRSFIGLDSADSTMDSTGEVGGTKTHTHPLSSAAWAEIRAASGSTNVWFKTIAVPSRAMEVSAPTSAATAITTASSTGVPLDGDTDAASSMPPFMVARWVARYMDVTTAPAGSTASITAVAGTVALRDANGRSQMVAPVAGLDIANKAYVDGKVGSNSVTTVNVVLYDAAGTYTYVPPSNLVYARVKVTAGGGGAGGAATSPASQSAHAGGAGGGAYAEALLKPSDFGASQTITVGAGGVRGSGTVGGLQGGTSSIGSLIVCAGGWGSAFATPSGAVFGNPGGLGGTVTGTVAGLMDRPGSPGDFGFGGPGLGVSGNGGASGSSGAGGRGNATGSSAQALAGADGVGPGGGGSGGLTTGGASAVFGGTGAPGEVIIEEYLAVVGATEAGINFYAGTTAPDPALGNDGDVYLRY